MQRLLHILNIHRLEPLKEICPLLLVSARSELVRLWSVPKTAAGNDD